MRVFVLPCALSIALAALPSARANDAIVRANNQLQVEAARQQIEYHEIDPAVSGPGRPYVDSEYGRQPGWRVAFDYQNSLGGASNVYLSLLAQRTSGGNLYVGALQNGTPYSGGTPSVQNEFQIRLGKGVPLGGWGQLTPFLQYDNHRWYRGQDVVPDYLEVYQHQALGAGALFQVAVGERLVLGVDAVWSHMLTADMHSDWIGDSFTLGNKNVANAGVRAEYAIDRHWRLTGGYDFTQFRYGAATLANGDLEPDSKTTLKAAHMGVGYAF